MSMTKFKGARKHARVYHGRDKGNTENHIPNNEFRENFGEMKWQSSIQYECPECGKQTLIHKTELKLFRCPCLIMT